jgi:hypothetical protein
MEPMFMLMFMVYMSYLCSAIPFCSLIIFIVVDLWYDDPVLFHDCVLIVVRNQYLVIFLNSGAPQTLIQSCLTFGTFSYIIETLNKQQPALALPLATEIKDQKAGQSVLPPFTLPLPQDAMDGFSKFQNFLSSKFQGK